MANMFRMLLNHGHLIQTMKKLLNAENLRSIVLTLLVSVLFVGMFVPSVEGQTAVNVGTEAELRAAVSNAANGVSVVISLDRPIGLTGGVLIIPANKDITLRSSGNAEFELFGASGAYTITVENQGTLTLAGIIVTHASGASGAGVSVNSGGRLTMTGGKISANTGNHGGVSVSGSFVMTGGKISDNTAFNCGGVYISSIGSFVMTGGEISSNRASASMASNGGGGVYNVGTFTMDGGEISNNTAPYGGGAWNGGTFTMVGGKISGNTASSYLGGSGSYGGGGVYNVGMFTMDGGEISNNTASPNGSGGGVYTAQANYGTTFTMSGGRVADNKATVGGGIVVVSGSFVVEGGKISGNTASGGGGGGIYIGGSGSASLSNCEISGNTASSNGGGCWVTDTTTNFNRLVVSDGVVFADNRAFAAYNRDSSHDAIYRAYIGDNVVWSEPFTQGYSNFDISYVFGTSITAFSVTVNDSYGTPTGAGSYSVGATVTLNAGTRTGYTFFDWAVNSGIAVLSNTTATTATFTMPTSHVVVTSRWILIQNDIRYVLNSGTNAAGNPTRYSVENSFPITIGNPTLRNYEFRGWNVTYADGTRVAFQVSYSIPTGTTGNIDLVANWAATSTGGNTGTSTGTGGGSSSSGSGSSGGGSGGGGSDVRYTVEFVDWDGRLLKSETVSYGGSVTPPMDPTSEGYIFTGWDNSEDSYTYVTKNIKVTALYRAVDDSATQSWLDSTFIGTTGFLALISIIIGIVLVISYIVYCRRHRTPEPLRNNGNPPKSPPAYKPSYTSTYIPSYTSTYKSPPPKKCNRCGVNPAREGYTFCHYCTCIRCRQRPARDGYTICDTCLKFSFMTGFP